MGGLGRLGQTTIEYLLLLAVLATLFTAVMRNERFQEYIGAQGSFFRDYSRIIEYHYHHGRKRGTRSTPPFPGYNSGFHDTYKNEGGGSNFAIPLGKYPQE